MWRSALLTGLAGTAFIIGSLIGFVFTSYGEESGTVGKVRDWIIGAVAGLTILKISAVRPLLLLFSKTNANADYALTVSVATVFTGFGFYCMYFGRELVFNIPLARRRAERIIVEANPQVGSITIQLNSILPPAFLSGTGGDAGYLFKKYPDTAEQLKTDIFSGSVQKFLDEVKTATETGRNLDWDVLSKAANLHYYRAYFVDEKDRSTYQSIALIWIQRALVLNPEHIDFSVKQVDLLSLLKRYQEAVSILERLYRRQDCPFFVEQWLTYYPLWLTGREDEVINCCKSYLQRFPDSNETLRNLACAHAQKVCLAANKSGTSIDKSSPDYVAAIAYLRDVLRTNPGHLTTIREKWTVGDGSFVCFKDDPQFKSIIFGEPEPASIPKADR